MNLKGFVTRITGGLVTKMRKGSPRGADTPPPNVTMIGTSPHAQGGVAAVAKALIEGSGAGLHTVDYLETHCDGGILAKLRLAVTTFFRFLHRLAVGKVAIVHVHVSSRMSFWRKCLLILPAYAFGRPVLLHLHSGDFHLFYEKESSRLMRRLIRYVFERAAGVVVLSTRRKAWVEESFPRSRVRVIYNPVPMGEASPTGGRNPETVLFFGRLGDQKGTGDLVQAVAKLMPNFPNIRLLLGGDGDLAGTRELAERLGIGRHVETLGWVTGEQKRRLLQSATVFTLPSYNEGLPMGVLEAMADGLPVVSTPVGGIPEAITDGVEGFLVQPGDVDGLADRLGRLLKDPALHQAMSEAARRKVESTFALDRIIPQWLELYAEQGVVSPLRHGK